MRLRQAEGAQRLLGPLKPEEVTEKAKEEKPKKTEDDEIDFSEFEMD